MDIHYPHDKPKSLLVFLAGLTIGLVIFVPLAITGLALEKVGLFLTGSAGIAATWLPAAFMGFLFTAGLYAGRYKQMEDRPWRDQVW